MMRRRLAFGLALALALVVACAGCKITTQPVKLGPGIACAAAASGPDPIVEVLSYPAEVDPDTDFTIALRASSPASETERSYNVIVHYTPDAAVQIQHATGPQVIRNGTVTTTWEDSVGSSFSYQWPGTVAVRVRGRTQTIAPSAGAVDIPLGHMDPGQTLELEVVCRVP